jgi:hypothetical protein
MEVHFSADVQAKVDQLAMDLPPCERITAGRLCRLFR